MLEIKSIGSQRVLAYHIKRSSVHCCWMWATYGTRHKKVLQNQQLWNDSSSSSFLKPQTGIDQTLIFYFLIHYPDYTTLTGLVYTCWQINLSYCSVTDAGLLALASRSPLQNITILHLAGLSPNGLAAALLACRGLKKAKIHESFKAMLPQSLLNHMESRGCIFHWRDKAFQPQVISLDKSLFLCLITNDRENPNH